jgi:hypothetical protein
VEWKKQPENEFSGPVRDTYIILRFGIFPCICSILLRRPKLIIGNESLEIACRVDNLYAESFQLVASLKTDGNAPVRATSVASAVTGFNRKGH